MLPKLSSPSAHNSSVIAFASGCWQTLFTSFAPMFVERSVHGFKGNCLKADKVLVAV